MRCGIDIIKTSRFLNKKPSFFKKYFTQNEIEYAKSKPAFEQTISGIFALKEAFLKAIGIGVFRGIELSDVQISHNSQGKPVILLTKAIKKQYRIKKIDASISHDGDFSIALCVIN